jgi:hypothetical protein
MQEMSDPRAPINRKIVPAEIDRWNWGAFLLNWIWGVGNNTYIALLTLIPFFGLIIMPFVLGAKGSGWAWRNGRWDSVEHFKRVQRAWAIWGAAIWLGSIVLFGGLFGGSFYLLGHSEAYQIGVSQLQASTEASNILGPPISTGFPLGSVSSNATDGRAVLSFSATGTKATGRVFLEAIKKNGVWSLVKLSLGVEGHRVIDLIGQSKVESEGAEWRSAELGQSISTNTGVKMAGTAQGRLCPPYDTTHGTLKNPRNRTRPPRTGAPFNS